MSFMGFFNGSEVFSLEVFAYSEQTELILKSE